MSIDDELLESFESSINNIEKKIEGEFNTLPQSNFHIYDKIIDSELETFYDTLLELVDYYSGGIYNSGKVQVRKDANLPIEKEKGKKYVFNRLDENILSNYKSQRLINFINKIKTDTKIYIYNNENDNMFNVIYSSYNNIFKLLIDELRGLFEMAKSSEYEQVRRNNSEE